MSLTANDETPARGRGHELPWQVKAVGAVGIPGLMVLALLYVFVEERGDRTVASINRQREEVIERVATQITREHQEQLEVQWLQLRLLRQICLNGAQTNDERRACVSGDSRR